MNPSKFFIKISKNLKCIYKISERSCCKCPPIEHDPIVTIFNASTKIGKHLALLLKQSPHLGELRLFDGSESVCSVAEDLSHIDTNVKIKSFCGRSTMNSAVVGADVVISVGGCKSSPSETPKDLFKKNVDQVRIAALHLIEFNPKAIFCLANPPIEALVPLVSEEYKKAGVYDSRKIIGITSPVTMRANYYVASETGKNAATIMCPVVGGVSSNCLVGVISQVKPDLSLNPRAYSNIQKKLANSEDDVLKLYADCGTLCLAPALAISRFINILLRALKGDINCVECAFIRQTGHIGQFLPYMTSIVRLGSQGILSSHMPKVNAEERQHLKIASHVIQDLINLGESFVTGEIKAAPKCQMVNPKPTTENKTQEQKTNENLYFKKDAKIVQ